MPRPRKNPVPKNLIDAIVVKERMSINVGCFADIDYIQAYLQKNTIGVPVTRSAAIEWAIRVVARNVFEQENGQIEGVPKEVEFEV